MGRKLSPTSSPLTSSFSSVNSALSPSCRPGTRRCRVFEREWGSLPVRKSLWFREGFNKKTQVPVVLGGRRSMLGERMGAGNPERGFEDHIQRERRPALNHRWSRVSCGAMGSGSLSRTMPEAWWHRRENVDPA